jgi:hypothetical protein
MQARMIRGVLSVAGVLPLLLGSGAAQSFNFDPIDGPCSDCSGGIALATTAYGINPAGDIVGTYTDKVGQHGFLRKDGQFMTIDVPSSLVGGSPGTTLPTIARGISPDGDIVGSFTAPVNSAPTDPLWYCPKTGSTFCIKGFLYHRGKFSLVLYPGQLGTIAQRITPAGGIYGCLHGADMMGSMYGYGMTRLGDSSLQADGGELADSTQSLPASMENGATPDGRIRVGFYASDFMDPNKVFTHGYVVEDGLLGTYDFPGPVGPYQTGPSGPFQTFIWDMNTAGDFVGYYYHVGSPGQRHGFVQPGNGSAPVTVDYPEAISTSIAGINPGGTIVGQQVDTAMHVHGFVAVPSATN